MEQVKSRQRSIGAQFFPLTSLNAAARFFSALLLRARSIPCQCASACMQGGSVGWSPARKPDRRGRVCHAAACAQSVLRMAFANCALRCLRSMGWSWSRSTSSAWRESALTTEVHRGTRRGYQDLQHTNHSRQHALPACAPKEGRCMYASTGPVRVTLRPKTVQQPGVWRAALPHH